MNPIPHPIIHRIPSNDHIAISINESAMRLMLHLDKTPDRMGLLSLESPGLMYDYMMVHERSHSIQEMIQLTGKDAHVLAHDMANYAYGVRFDELGGAIFETTEELDSLMANTDVGDVPMSAIKLPHDTMYFHLKNPAGEHDGDLYVTGIYLAKDLRPGRENSFHLALTVSANGNWRSQGIVSFADAQMQPEETGNFLEVFAKKIGERFDTVEHKALNDRMVAATRHVVKTLLYVNVKEARIRRNNELTDFRTRLVNLGIKKQKKLASQIDKKYDRIIVGPESPNTSSLEIAANSNNDATRTTHWRRGHFRNQRIGEGRKDSVIIWIQPMIINAANLEEDGAEPAKKTYKVKL